ncbi:MAG: response regulator, partial [Spirochaetia bacterium]|nr:response regulator [Spirochaetia bacterium]
ILELSVLNIVETAKPEKTSSISMIPKSSEHAKILVAEDNEINQMLIKIMLEKLNHKVEIAKNGKIAIEMATANSYDLIFMDIELPELKGDEAARILKFEKNINIPIVALTANSISENIRRYLKNGLDDCLLKPYKQEELEAMIIKWLGYK